MNTTSLSDAQIAAINAQQHAGHVHPFTCGNANCREVLVADKDGMRCPKCDYRQAWVPEIVANTYPVQRRRAMRRRIDVETIELALRVIGDLNRLDLHAVDFYRDGELVPVTAEQIDEWRFTGLSNRDFVQYFLLGCETSLSAGMGGRT